MKLKQTLTQTSFSVVLLTTAGFVSGLTLSTPAQASTFAASDSIVELFNFSIAPFDTGANTFTNTQTLSFDGVVTAEANAVSLFPASSGEPTAGGNFVSAFATGQGNHYFGVAEGNASLGAGFKVNRNELFSFGFGGSIQLLANVDQPQVETARALGGITLNISTLKPNGSPGKTLDSFSALALLNNPGRNDSEIQSTGNFSLLSRSIERTPKGNQESILVTFRGAYERVFNRDKTIHLAEGKVGAAAVSSTPKRIPEPLTILGSVFAVGIGGWLRKQYLADHNDR